jgi:glycosyltransferase involved in cell wall biosynthesis
MSVKSPLITVITVCYNSEKFIADAIESVLAQDFENFEYLIIDGASKDRTFEIAESYRVKHPTKIKLVSERDKGIYDAMNKGIKLANGEVIGFLNSDDFYSSIVVLSKIAQVFREEYPDFIYGDLLYVNQANTEKIVRRWISGNMPVRKMKFGWHPPHPTLYVKAKLLKQLDGFDTQYKIGADYALMVKLIESRNPTYKYIPEVLVRMRVGGESNKSLENIYKQNLECVHSWRAAGLKPSVFLVPIKLMRKLMQFFYA